MSHCSSSTRIDFLLSSTVSGLSATLHITAQVQNPVLAMQVKQGREAFHLLFFASHHLCVAARGASEVVSDNASPLLASCTGDVLTHRPTSDRRSADGAEPS